MSVRWVYLSKAPLSIETVEEAMARLSRHVSWVDRLKQCEELVFCSTRHNGPLSSMDLHKKIPMIHHNIHGTIPSKQWTDEALCKVVDVLRLQADVSEYSDLWVKFEEKWDRQTRKADAGQAVMGIYRGPTRIGRLAEMLLCKPLKMLKISDSAIRRMAFSYGAQKNLPQYRYLFGKGERHADPTARKQAIEEIIAVMELPVLVDWDAPKVTLKHKKGLQDPNDDRCSVPTSLDVGLSRCSSEQWVGMLKKTVDHFSSGRVFDYHWFIADPFPTREMPKKIPSWMRVERQEDIIPQLWEKLVELDMPAEKIEYSFYVPVRTLEEVKALLALGLRKAEYHFDLGYWNYADEDGDPAQGELNFWYKKNAIYLQLDMQTPDDISNIADIIGVEFKELPY